MSSILWEYHSIPFRNRSWLLLWRLVCNIVQRKFRLSQAFLKDIQPGGAGDFITRHSRINHPIFSSCTNSITTSIEIVDLAGSPFSFSYHNRFIAIGCSIYASMKSPHGYVIAACISACKKFAPYSYSQGCYGFKCCQTTIPWYPKVFNATIETRNTAIIEQECKYAFLVEQNWFKAHETNTIELEVQNISYVPVVLELGHGGLVNYFLNF